VRGGGLHERGSGGAGRHGVHMVLHEVAVVVVELAHVPQWAVAAPVGRGPKSCVPWSCLHWFF
jgi:hypothetical protein